MYHPTTPPRPTPHAVAERLYANAYAALGEGRTQDALQHFILMTGVAPFDERAWVGLGASLEQKGETRRALKAYESGVSAAPHSVFCKLGQARTLFQLGEVQKAHRLLDQAEVDANATTEVQLIDQLRGEL